MGKSLNRLSKEAYINSKNHGFHDSDNVEPGSELFHLFVSQKLALIHSELSEALEADRKDNYCRGDSGYLSDIVNQPDNEFKYLFEKYIKNTFEDELADVLIRVFDLCGWLNIDLDKHIEMKMKYNSLREKNMVKNINVLLK